MAVTPSSRISELREAIRLAWEAQRQAAISAYTLEAEIDRLLGNDLSAEFHEALVDCYRDFNDEGAKIRREDAFRRLTRRDDERAAKRIAGEDAA